MKISQNISFSKQLIIYLILVLFVVFFLISLALVNSLEQFINNNAYSQAKAIANNALIIFEREIARIESIPQNVTDMQGELNYKNIPDLPIRILRSYKTLIGSSVHYDLKNPEEPVKVAEHKDIDDEGQTVLITERKILIHTTATDKNGKKEIESGKDLTIVDTVTLEGLEIGTKYKLSGWQMVKAENAKLLIDGKEITNDYEFTADKENMEVQIEFTFDGSTLGGADIG